ncbi:hypothetical protein GUJ93_ZPchr0008g11425 [Zizania palustris]|uniref:DUF674 family protein n=1 Tax=Zizania palustris TaxID=103762 RepID=A0A8J5RG29_ZIZPA|nr:hypothetical protein GUJ93_ZPchr0008g11425 [Zizania palustris]
MAAAATSVALRMKLLIDTNTQRVLFAEAGKDVVDFLFSLLALPVGTAVKLLGKESMVGCVGNLYASVEKLDDSYVQSHAAKDALLRPAVLSPAVTCNNPVLRLPAPPSESPSAQPESFFGCYNINRSLGMGRSRSRKFGKCNYVTDASGVQCPSCCGQMTEPYQYVAPCPGQKTEDAAAAGVAKGFVQGIVTYTVMDDLTVSPMSSISSIALLNTFAVTDLAALQERTVQLDYAEGLAILKASMQSKTVLTDVFAGEKPARQA